MSSLMNAYRKLTDPTNQGIFSNEELLLSQGRVYLASDIERTFGLAAVVNFIITTGDDLVAVSDLIATSDSEEFKSELFLNPVFTGGTSVPLINQLAGSARAALSSVVVNPSISNDGIAGSISITRGIAGQGNKGGFSEGVRDTSSLISPNTKLLLRITNQGVIGQLDVSIRLGEVAVTI